MIIVIVMIVMAVVDSYCSKSDKYFGNSYD